VNYCRYLLLIHTEVYRAIKCPEDCKPLQSDVDSVQGWGTGKCMKLNIIKTKKKKRRRRRRRRSNEILIGLKFDKTVCIRVLHSSP
jgi:hypothetical protein